MYLFKVVKNLIGHNVWIPVGALISSILLLKLSDSSVVVKISCWLLPGPSSYFAGNLFVTCGLTLLLSSFGMFFLWMNAYRRQRLAQRKSAMRQAAAEMRWNFNEHQNSALSPYLNEYKRCRILGIKSNSFCASFNISNVLSQTIGSDSFIVFDSELTETTRDQDRDSFVHAETVYLVVSDNLNLPSFQTQPASWFGDNVVADFLKNKAGIDDYKFPHRPDFSKKYILNGGDRQSIERAFTPAVFDFYEQNQIYRTVGDGKMFCLIQPQTEFINRLYIGLQLQTADSLHRLLKISHQSSYG